MSHWKLISKVLENIQVCSNKKKVTESFIDNNNFKLLIFKSMLLLFKASLGLPVLFKFLNHKKKSNNHSLSNDILIIYIISVKLRS